MIAFQQSLRKWEAYVLRATGCSAVSYVVEDSGNFSVVLRWPSREFRRQFVRESVFPRIAAGRAVRPHKKVCKFVDDIIMEALEHTRAPD